MESYVFENLHAVVGLRYDSKRLALGTDLEAGDLLLILPEPDNPADKNALAVYYPTAQVYPALLTSKRHHLGYLRAALAAELAGFDLSAVDLVAQVEVPATPRHPVMHVRITVYEKA